MLVWIVRPEIYFAGRSLSDLRFVVTQAREEIRMIEDRDDEASFEKLLPTPVPPA